MDELRESSLLFSLASLHETERQRVEREAREAQARCEQELQRVAELAERRRLAAQQEREARARRQALQQERERLEQGRLEAMKQATVERARAEAEAQARLVELEQRRQHDLALSRLSANQTSARYRTLFWLGNALSLAVLGLALAGVLLYLRPTHAREQGQLRAVIAALEARASASERALAAERGKSGALEERLLQLEASASKPGAAAAVTTREGRQPPRGTRVVGERPRPCLDNGDPLDGCVR